MIAADKIVLIMNMANVLWSNQLSQVNKVRPPPTRLLSTFFFEIFIVKS